LNVKFAPTSLKCTSGFHIHALNLDFAFVFLDRRGQHAYVCPNGLINILLLSLLKGIHPVGTSRTYTGVHVKMHMLLHNICRLNLLRNARGQQMQREHTRRNRSEKQNFSGQAG